MDFYLNLLNDTQRGEGDQPSIASSSALKRTTWKWNMPFVPRRSHRVAVYQLHSKLPADMKGKLPTEKQLADVVRAVLPERSAP